MTCGGIKPITDLDRQYGSDFFVRVNEYEIDDCIDGKEYVVLMSYSSIELRKTVEKNILDLHLPNFKVTIDSNCPARWPFNQTRRL